MLLVTFTAKPHCCLKSHVYQDSQIFPSTFQPSKLHFVLVDVVVPFQVQDLGFPLAEPYKVPVSSFHSSVEFPLTGSTALWYQPLLLVSDDSTTVLTVYSTIVCNILQVINEYVKLCLPQFHFLGSATSV